MSDEQRTTSPRREDASIGEVVEYVTAYAKQETIGPLTRAGQWIGFGAAGAVTLGIGISLLLLGLLRLLQTEWTWSASGRWSWVSYLIVLVVSVLLIGLTLWRINKTFLHKERNQ